MPPRLTFLAVSRILHDMVSQREVTSGYRKAENCYSRRLSVPLTTLRGLLGPRAHRTPPRGTSRTPRHRAPVILNILNHWDILPELWQDLCEKRECEVAGPGSARACPGKQLPVRVRDMTVFDPLPPELIGPEAEMIKKYMCHGALRTPSRCA